MKTVVIDEVNEPFVSPDTKSASKILKSFKATKKYSPEFLKDLEEGLRESTYFEK